MNQKTEPQTEETEKTKKRLEKIISMANLLEKNGEILPKDAQEMRVIAKSRLEFYDL